ncbi:MAG TPA: sigma-70 family RNA polymerase sigma factor [Solirubrobacterales bacterium]
MSFAGIYRRYHQELYRYCLAIVGNPDDAQDALQNTMIKAMRALRDEQREIKLKPWLYRIAHNESVDLLRGQRPTEPDVEIAETGLGPADTALLHERLQRLIADLEELPERQRGALVMRELSGLSFKQIGEAFSTSPAVARQTVYEARQSLRQMEEGREMSCEQVMRALSDADGRIVRRRDIRAHLRGCQSCRDFRRGISERREELAALAPLPALAAAGVLQGVLGSTGGGSAAGALGAGAAGKAVATSVIAKSAATVAAVAVIGAGAADRGGLIDLPLSSGGGSEQGARQEPGVGSATGAPAAQGSAGKTGAAANDVKTQHANDRSGGDSGSSEAASKQGGSEPPASSGAGHSHGPAAGLPAASSHGQQTAAAHKSPGGGRSHSQGKSKGHAKASPSPPKAKAHAPAPNHPSTPAKPPTVTPDKSTTPSFQSPQPESKGAPETGARPLKEAQ